MSTSFINFFNAFIHFFNETPNIIKHYLKSEHSLGKTKP
jgi:hypothetical protein